MAIPFLSVLAAIPWPAILKQAPALLGAADAMLAKSRSRSAALAEATDVQALRQRIVELEANQQACADLVKQLADHVTAVSAVAEAAAARVRQSVLFATAALGLGVIACLLAWFK